MVSRGHRCSGLYTGVDGEEHRFNSFDGGYELILCGGGFELVWDTLCDEYEIYHVGGHGTGDAGYAGAEHGFVCDECGAIVPKPLEAMYSTLTSWVDKETGR